MFTNRQIGKTLVNRTQGTRIASEGLKYRVFEVSLTDLQNDQDAERFVNDCDFSTRRRFEMMNFQTIT